MLRNIKNNQSQSVLIGYFADGRFAGEAAISEISDQHTFALFMFLILISMGLLLIFSIIDNIFLA